MQPARLPFARDERLDVRARAQSGSQTSARAAESLTGTKPYGAKLARLMRAFVKAGERGLTDSEAESQTGISRMSLCSLRANAREKGWIVTTADTRVGSFGKEQAVSRITDRGRQVWSEAL
jgi:hypothetical protein